MKKDLLLDDGLKELNKEETAQLYGGNICIWIWVGRGLYEIGLIHGSNCADAHYLYTKL